MINAAVVHVIEDDEDYQTVLSKTLSLEGYSVLSYKTAEIFLEKYRVKGSGCIIIDFSLPGLNGLQLQERLIEIECPLPIIFLTGRGTVKAATQALKSGAFDFLEKPASTTEILAAVQAAVIQSMKPVVEKLFEDTLTSKQAPVYRLMKLGMNAREIGDNLGISPRTVEFHRKNILDKKDEFKNIF